MKMILKGCSRCGGDLLPDRWDLEGQDMCCVQCGHTASAALVRRTAEPQAQLRSLNQSYALASAERRVA